jgi:hypothetical protein
MGINHLQAAQRARTIDAHPRAPGSPSDPYGEAFRAVDFLIQRLETRLDQQEAALRALHDTVTELQAALRKTVTHNAEAVTPVTPDRDFVTEAVTPRNAYRNAERQRRYRERKKQSPGT